MITTTKGVNLVRKPIKKENIEAFSNITIDGYWGIIEYECLLNKRTVVILLPYFSKGHPKGPLGMCLNWYQFECLGKIII